MANLSITNTFSPGTVAKSSEVNTNFSDISTYINARNGGSASWDYLNVTNNVALSGTLAVTGVATLSGGIPLQFGYRRPNLKFISVTQIDVENNTSTANQTSIMFPDGTIRSVTENTASTHKYRRFDITATAEFTSGTEDSGLRSTLSESTNTWYAIYAVKSAINTSNFVLVGDTTLPLQANVSTLNGYYGANGWLYLGMIRNGDSVGATGDILSFEQGCGITRFKNSCVGTTTTNGIRIATNSSTTLTYTYAAGTGSAQIPNHINMLGYIVATTASNGAYVTVDASSTFLSNVVSAGAGARTVISINGVQASAGLTINSSASGTLEIFLSTLYDPALGTGTNPII